MTGDLIVCVGFEYAEPVAAWAAKYANLSFILVDTAAPAVLPNLVSVTFAEDDFGYLAGVSAGVITRSQVRYRLSLFYDSQPKTTR